MVCGLFEVGEVMLFSRVGVKSPRSTQPYVTYDPQGYYEDVQDYKDRKDNSLIADVMFEPIEAV